MSWGHCPGSRGTPAGDWMEREPGESGKVNSHLAVRTIISFFSVDEILKRGPFVNELRFSLPKFGQKLFRRAFRRII